MNTSSVDQNQQSLTIKKKKKKKKKRFLMKALSDGYL